jgi:FkbH-like protein
MSHHTQDDPRSIALQQIQETLGRLPSEPAIAQLLNARRELAGILDGDLFTRIKLACASSFTFEPMKTAIELQALQVGLLVDVFIAPFGQFEQQLLDPSSALSAFSPDVLLMAIRLEDACPAIYDAFGGISATSAQEVVDGWRDRFWSAVGAFRSRCPAKLLVQNYDLPPYSALGLGDGSTDHSQISMIQNANRQLLDAARATDNVYVMDYDALVARHGRIRWADARMSFYARIPVAPANYWHLAGFYASHLRPLYGLSKKVLCLDADNTLWGGVVGDVGPNGIELGPDYPGNAFIALQKAALDLYHRGVVLCLNSKNDSASVLEVLDSHPSMILRRNHFAAMRINWEPKPANLRAMAAELNLGMDAFVFVDDSPVECELMRTTLPEVSCLALPREPAQYEQAIRSLSCFDQWTISSEDRNRGQLYQAESKRRELAAQIVDLPGFYRQLQMRMTITIDDAMQVSRAAQMTQRTNQFNMNTIRCTDDDIRGWMAAPDHNVLTLALSDKFGDNGVVGMAVIRNQTHCCHLHMLLLSCRILGRTVEQTFIHWIGRRARDLGALKLTAAYVPTGKNKPFAGFYQSCGFHQNGPDKQFWCLELERADTSIPDYMTIIEPAPPERH